ncbi:hypothetical protein EAS64_38100 [Trebonia kvetii]|uniref:Uncharacterized protein n=1 Tax=Trebonia kvetii TaxID=2480626 RepID=A0A6P2BMZ8_9ACTN|nr:hypothetical protein [Trebonia kvetii]TVZ00439.1 hypothetical protein EAS64_38100 [Trebonia kvetii]
MALARLDGKDYQQSSTAALNGTDPGADPPAPESRDTRPPESRWSVPPPATTQGLPEAHPPWGTPQANTIRMWTRKRFMLAGAIIVAAMLFCGGALTVTLIHRTTVGNGRAGPGLTGPLSGGPPPDEAAIAGAAAARTAAAAWIARQVDPAAIIACDPQMCAVLQGDGIPAARLLLLGTGNAAPLGSDVIVSTAAVREEFGSRLTSVYAPVALATFGSGSARVTVLVVAADGSAAYQRSLQTDASARRSVGAQLLRNPDVRVSPVGRRELAAGQVDARLLSVIAALATPYHLDITGFGAPTAGADPAVPLRSADISVAPAGSGGAAATLNAAKRFLLAQQSPYRPAEVTTVQLADGRAALHVEFSAPSPLGLLGSPN